jgi:hypothetical protein
MQKLNIKTEQVKGEKRAAIIVKCTNDVAENIVRKLVDVFETEMYYAEINCDKENTTIKMTTDNMDKIESLRKGMCVAFREISGIGKIETN